ncbi:MAG: alkaline shock response membrane anchor protein AmaP [Candidatus Omnitrophica bacterium]|nr:alkaline shock response membrane anchor protein AmaP [Candidatus Omnitrophota bacterium]MBU1038423.1 alkaline shock response membrane anchor protein AmaP [Candidatus Omnitrophota bacterium]MBU1809451.1 alkaline shock response membrane anchor protein AmaP [Candidatus Omnitrophota bacterium]
MRFLGGLTLFFYTFIFLLVGGSLVAISLNLITQESIMFTLETIYFTPNARACLGITGALLIFISVLVMQVAMGKLTREKTIAFENPDGQVTISLSAIEDFIKRALKQLPEVKELRPSVRASKKGISIINKVTLFSDISIPETTEKIQNLVKSRVQDMLGVEEPINIKVHVVKIAHKEDAAKSVKKDDKPPSPQFRGNIEY